MGTIQKSPEFLCGPTSPSGGAKATRIEIPPVLVARLGRTAIELRSGLPDWMFEVAHSTMTDVSILLDNGADQAAHIRVSMVLKFVDAEKKWSDEEVDVEEAASLTGVCEETIRRKVRSGQLSSTRAGE